MKFVLLTLCFSLAIRVCACAQRAILWQPDTVLMVGGKVGYSRVVVEDARTARENIGWIKTGALNRYADLVTDGPLSKSLEDYATHLLRGAERAQGVLLVVLRDFRVEDRKGGEEIGTVHLRADLFQSNGSEEAYAHLRVFDTLYETKSLDVTRGTLLLASQAIMDMLGTTRGGPAVAGTLYTQTQAIAREDAAKSAWPLYTTQPAVPGLYQSLDDFLTLRTTDTSFITQRVASPDAPPVYYFYRKNSRGKKGERIRPNDCVAIWDGKDWHVAHHRGFSVLKRDGSDYYATIYLPGFADNSVMMAIGLGVVSTRTLDAADQSLHWAPYRARLVPELGRFAPVRRVR